MPAYVVLHDKTIQEIAARLPRDETALLAVSGLGKKKLETYGADILAVLAKG